MRIQVQIEVLRANLSAASTTAPEGMLKMQKQSDSINNNSNNISSLFFFSPSDVVTPAQEHQQEGEGGESAVHVVDTVFVGHHHNDETSQFVEQRAPFLRHVSLDSGLMRARNAFLRQRSKGSTIRVFMFCAVPLF